jgi:hypothetical protein
MKNTRSIVGALCLVAGGLLCTVPALAGENDEYIGSLPQLKLDLIEVNLVNALQSGIPGMQADAAQIVRDINSMRPEQNFPKTVIPLMAILKNEEAESGSRILAALALNQLDSQKGYFAISRTASFTSDTRLKYVCSWLAYERTTGKPSGEKGIAYFEPLPEGDE